MYSLIHYGHVMMFTSKKDQLTLNSDYGPRYDPGLSVSKHLPSRKYTSQEIFLVQMRCTKPTQATSIYPPSATITTEPFSQYIMKLNPQPPIQSSSSVTSRNTSYTATKARVNITKPDRKAISPVRAHEVKAIIRYTLYCNDRHAGVSRSPSHMWKCPHEYIKTPPK